MINYKCPKCGNKEAFTLRSFVEIEQDCHQGKKFDDYSSFNNLGQHYTKDVICKKCGAIIIEIEHEVIKASILSEIKQTYLNWYNSDVDEESKETAKAMYKIGELLKKLPGGLEQKTHNKKSLRGK